MVCPGSFLRSAFLRGTICPTLLYFENPCDLILDFFIKKDLETLLLRRDFMKKSEVTLFNCLDTWLQNHIHGFVSKGSYVCYRCAIKQLKEVMEDKGMDQTTYKDYQNALLQLAEKGYSHSTITKARTVIYSVLESVYGYRQLNLKIPRNAPTKKILPLNENEQYLIEQACLSDPYGDIFLFLLYTGLRRSELCNLKWNNIDFEKECMYILKSKTDHGIRTVPLLPICIWILSRLPRCSEFVFTIRSSQNKGQPITPHSLRRTYQRIRKNTDVQNLTNHICRHSFATRLLEEGAEIKSISELMGHSNASFTLNQYVHPSENYLKKQISLLNQRIKR